MKKKIFLGLLPLLALTLTACGGGDQSQSSEQSSEPGSSETSSSQGSSQQSSESSSQQQSSEPGPGPQSSEPGPGPQSSEPGPGPQSSEPGPGPQSSEDESSEDESSEPEESSEEESSEPEEDPRGHEELIGEGVEFLINGLYYTVEEQDADPGRNASYHLDDIELSEDDEVYPYVNGEAVQFWAEADAENDSYPNYKELPGESQHDHATIYEDATVTFYFHENVDNSYSLWATPTHGNGGEPVDPGDDPSELAYAIYDVANEEILCQLEADGKDASDRDQFKGTVALTAGDVIQLYDLNNEAGWVCAVEGWSFGGTSDDDTAYEDYLQVGTDSWTVLQDCEVDVYAKFAFGNDSIYFGLKGGEDPVDPGDEPEPSEYKYCIYNVTDSEMIVGLEADGKDFQDRDQFKGTVSLTAGQVIQLYDLENNAGWVCPIEGWSFGGTSADDTAYEAYLQVGATSWTVLQDCELDIYAKFAMGRDEIYFGLK